MLASKLNDQGELFMDFTGKKNAEKAELILRKHFKAHGVIAGNKSRFQDVLEQADDEIGPVSTDLLYDETESPQGADPEVLDYECEYVFESVNHMFPALAKNGREVQAILDWHITDETSHVNDKNI